MRPHGLELNQTAAPNTHSCSQAVLGLGREGSRDLSRLLSQCALLGAVAVNITVKPTDGATTDTDQADVCKGAGLLLQV